MSTSTLSTSNITSGFIDLATFEELDKYLYGGDGATNYFVAEHSPSIWFTQVLLCCLARQARQTLGRTGA